MDIKQKGWQSFSASARAHLGTVYGYVYS
uniref:Uncharacterized protein n=1 Tax=Rhizophora mucronata TaxID=61149 RepID=A0A2P2Q3R5_RHIMU